MKVAAALIGALVLVLVGCSQTALNVLTWRDNSTNEENFIIDRKAEPCASNTLPFAQVAAVGANVTTYTDNAVQKGVVYCYRVTATNAAGRSAYSNTAERTP